MSDCVWTSGQNSFSPEQVWQKLCDIESKVDQFNEDMIYSITNRLDMIENTLTGFHVEDIKEFICCHSFYNFHVQLSFLQLLLNFLYDNFDIDVSSGYDIYDFEKEFDYSSGGGGVS